MVEIAFHKQFLNEVLQNKAFIEFISLNPFFDPTFDQESPAKYELDIFTARPGGSVKKGLVMDCLPLSYYQSLVYAG
jgi:hypothetical protein